MNLGADENDLHLFPRWTGVTCFIDSDDIFSIASGLLKSFQHLLPTVQLKFTYRKLGKKNLT